MEKSMKELNYELKTLCKHNRDGSTTTQKDRQHQLQLMSRQLDGLGFKQMTVSSLKPKHVDALLQLWANQDLSAGTIKNRMSVLRWWTQKINKAGLIPKDNQALGIPQRQYLPQFNRAKIVSQEQLDAIKDPYLRMSFQLQQHFGLRREESIKFQPSYADLGDKIQLKGSWTKGGRPRTIPIRTVQQRALLNQAKQLTGNSSLIPADKSYIQQRQAYDNQCKQLGIHNLHGLRHMYAQSLYETLTKWKAPINGGPSRKDLQGWDISRDRQARQKISADLGHSRIEITFKYLGK